MPKKIDSLLRNENLRQQAAVVGLHVYTCRYESDGLTEFIVAKSLNKAREMRPNADTIRAASHHELETIALRALTGEC